MAGRAVFLALVGASLAALIGAAAPAAAQSDSCRAGFVPRLADPQDQVCVAPQTRAQILADNAAAAQRRAPGGGDACLFGYVWRLANEADHVCVTQETRRQTISDTAAAASRLAGAAAAKPTIAAPSTIPSAPPEKEGCYKNTGTEWQEIPCATQDFIKQHYPPPEVQFSIQSDPKPITPKPGFPPISYTLPLVWGSVLVGFVTNPTVAMETDNHFGVNAYSLQANTNFFAGNNGHYDWVQFVDQSRPGHPDGVCVWNVDVTAQSYNPTCVSAPRSVPDRPLTGKDASTGIPVVVTGYIAASGKLVMFAQLPDAGGWWSVVAPDTYGLSGNWTDVSGSILGLGGASQAVFQNATLETLVGARSCLAPYTAATCPAGSAPTELEHELVYYAAPYYSGVTGESNNLVPVVGSPPAHEPALFCLTNDCALWYNSTAP